MDAKTVYIFLLIFKQLFGIHFDEYTKCQILIMNASVPANCKYIVVHVSIGHVPIIWDWIYRFLPTIELQVRPRFMLRYFPFLYIELYTSLTE